MTVATWSVSALEAADDLARRRVGGLGGAYLRRPEARVGAVLGPVGHVHQAGDDRRTGDGAAPAAPTRSASNSAA